MEAAEAVVSGQWLVVSDRPDVDSAGGPGFPTLTTDHWLLATDVLDLLTALVDKSLVVEEPGAETRYRLLETVRQYSGERLRESGEAAAAREGHSNWFLTLAERAEPHLCFGAEQVDWLDRLEREHDNLRAALAWCLEAAGCQSSAIGEESLAVTDSRRLTAGGPQEAAVRLAAALAWFWAKRGHLGEARPWLERLLARGAGASASARGERSRERWWWLGTWTILPGKLPSRRRDWLWAERWGTSDSPRIPSITHAGTH